MDRNEPKRFEWTELDQMKKVDQMDKIGLNGNKVDRIRTNGLNRTEVDRMDRTGPNWTK